MWTQWNEHWGRKESGELGSVHFLVIHPPNFGIPTAKQLGWDGFWLSARTTRKRAQRFSKCAQSQSQGRASQPPGDTHPCSPTACGGWSPKALCHLRFLSLPVLYKRCHFLSIMTGNSSRNASFLMLRWGSAPVLRSAHGGFCANFQKAALSSRRYCHLLENSPIPEYENLWCRRWSASN